MVEAIVFFGGISATLFGLWAYSVLRTPHGTSRADDVCDYDHYGWATRDAVHVLLALLVLSCACLGYIVFRT